MTVADIAVGLGFAALFVVAAKLAFDRTRPEVGAGRVAHERADQLSASIRAAEERLTAHRED